MAKGDVTLFNQLAQDVKSGQHNFQSTDVFKLGLVDDTITPTAADTSANGPKWDDYSGNEVSAGGNYVTGGLTLAYTSATRWNLTGGVGKYDADDLELAQHAEGFTNARWGILYNDSHANDRAVGFVDLGGAVSEQAGPVAIRWNADGIVRTTVNPV
jgi:hypothetical protein